MRSGRLGELARTLCSLDGMALAECLGLGMVGHFVVLNACFSFCIFY